MEEGNVNVNTRWIMAPKGTLKCNVRSYFSQEPLPNGNHSSIGVVFRNSLGNIMHMTAGSLGFEDQKENQFNAFMEGMKQAFYKDSTKIIIETDEVDPYWEWHNSMVLGGQSQHEFILQQLSQRRADNNFIAEVRLVDREDNMLAAYLAKYGAQNWKQMVIIEEPFGRVEEIWNYDMGLGNYGNRFRAVLQGEVNPSALVEEVVNPPQEDLNHNVNGDDHMEEINAPNGMDILAAVVAYAAVVPEANGVGVDSEDEGENNEMEVVIGLAAVLLVNGAANAINEAH